MADKKQAAQELRELEQKIAKKEESGEQNSSAQQQQLVKLKQGIDKLGF